MELTAPTTFLIVVLSHGGHWLAGQEGAIDALYALPAQTPAASLRWELLADGVRLADGSVAMRPGDGTATVTIRCPNVRVRTALRWNWRLVQPAPQAGGNERELDRGWRTVYAYPDDLTAAWPALARGKRVAVVDRPDGLPRILARANVPHANFDDCSQLALARADIVLVGPGAIDASAMAQSPLVGLATAGASVMVFRQTEPPRLAGWPLAVRAVPQRLAWEMDHPLLNGADEALLASWREQWLAEQPRLPLVAIELPADEPALALARWPAESQGASRPAPVTALLVTRSLGKGRLVLCQLPLGNWLDDPRSQWLLGNAMDYLCSPPQPTPPPNHRPSHLPGATTAAGGAQPLPAPVPTITIPPGDRP